MKKSNKRLVALSMAAVLAGAMTACQSQPAETAAPDTTAA